MKSKNGRLLKGGETLTKEIDGKLVAVRLFIQRQEGKFPIFVTLRPESDDDDIGNGPGRPYRLESPDGLLEWTYDGPEYQFITPLDPIQRIQEPMTSSSSSHSNIVLLSLKEIKKRFPSLKEKDVFDHAKLEARIKELEIMDEKLKILKDKLKYKLGIIIQVKTDMNTKNQFTNGRIAAYNEVLEVISSMLNDEK